MKNRIRKPQNILKSILSPELTRSDYSTVMRFTNKLLKSGDAWKYNYHAIKSTLSQKTTQTTYAEAVKQLNVIVRPYREKK